MIHEQVVVGTSALAGELIVPDDARGLVIFAHGSGSSRHSPRNRFVAERLHRRRLTCEKRLDVVPRATHLFEEAGTLGVVADSASEWFATHLIPGSGE